MPWTVDATDDAGKALQGLLYLAASTATWQALTGYTPAPAVPPEHCYEEAADVGDLLAPRPRLIAEQADYGRPKYAPGDFGSTGALLLTVEIDVDQQDAGRAADELARFRNTLGALMSEMAALGGTGTGYFSGATHFCPEDMTLEPGSPGVRTITGRVENEEKRVTIAGAVIRVEWHGNL